MSIDLQDLFNEEGLGAPPAKLDTDYVIRRGRRVRVPRAVGSSSPTGGDSPRAAVGETAQIPHRSGDSGAFRGWHTPCFRGST